MGRREKWSYLLFSTLNFHLQNTNMKTLLFGFAFLNSDLLSWIRPWPKSFASDFLSVSSYITWKKSKDKDSKTTWNSPVPCQTVFFFFIHSKRVATFNRLNLTGLFLLIYLRHLGYLSLIFVATVQSKKLLNFRCHLTKSLHFKKNTKHCLIKITEVAIVNRFLSLFHVSSHWREKLNVFSLW